MKKILLCLIIFTFIIILFINNKIVLSSTIDATKIWLYKVFPYLFIMIIINDCLININIINLIRNPILYIFIMSLISGTPTSAYIISNLYHNKNISKMNANHTLLFTYFSNPLFLYTILNNIFINKYIVLKLIIIHYISNLIIFLIINKKLDKEISNLSYNSFNIADSIKKSINTNLMVLGSICFYLILSNIIIFLIPSNNYLNIFIRGLLEMTQGLNYLINYNFKYKEILTIIFISFGGLSIHTQVKSILDEYKLNYKYFLHGRIIQTIISLIITSALN